MPGLDLFQNQRPDPRIFGSIEDEVAQDFNCGCTVNRNVEISTLVIVIEGLIRPPWRPWIDKAFITIDEIIFEAQLLQTSWKNISQAFRWEFSLPVPPE
jgi:hypothetical protein